MKAKNLSIIILAILVSMMLNACGKHARPTGMAASIYQSASATKIGCLPEEITITDLDNHGGFIRQRDWFATCKGQTYFCSGVNNGYGGTTDVSCIKRSSNNEAVVEKPSSNASKAKTSSKKKRKDR